MKWWVGLIVGCVVYVSFGCDSRVSSGVKNPADATGLFSVEEEIRAPMLDVLWVVGGSESMCRPQLALAKSIGSFVEKLQLIGVDTRIAVVSATAQPFGRFLTQPAEFSASCSESEVLPDCAGLQLSAGVLSLSSADPTRALRCLLAVGGGQSGIEQGLQAAYLALDTSFAAVNREQAQAFLRKEAYLLIVFASSKDDCSLKPDSRLMEGDEARCALDTLKLKPVGEYVRFFKRLKSNDPGRVVVAVIGGDVEINGLPTTYPGFDTDTNVIVRREAYLSDLADGKQPTICKSNTAEYGRRYRELVQKFGSNGLFANICDDDLTSALDAISVRLGKLFHGVCLRRELSRVFDVTRIDSDGQATTLNPGSYLVTKLAGCITDANPSGTALILSYPPADTTVRIRYLAQ